MNHYSFEDIKVGQTISFEYELNQEKMDMFKKITGDENPLHNNLEYAKKAGYSEKVVYGMLTSAILSTLAGVYLPGEYSLIHSVEIDFVKPVYLSKCPLTIEAKVSELEERFKVFKLKYTIRDCEGTKVSKGTMQIGFTNK